MADIPYTATIPGQSPTRHKISPTDLTVMQRTFASDEPIDAGAPVYIKANGNVANVNTGAAGTSKVWGLAMRAVVAGEAITVVRCGPVDCFDLSTVAFGDPVFTSATVGRLADATSANARIVGTCVPNYGVAPGVTPDKVLYVQCTPSGT